MASKRPPPTALDPHTLSDVRGKAAVLLEQADEVEEAIALLQQAHDWQGMGRLITKSAPCLVRQGRGQTVEGWLAGLPRHVLEADPWLLYWYGVCRLPFDPLQSRGYFELAYEAFEHRGDAAGLHLAWCGAVDSIVYAWENFTLLDTWIERMEALRRRAAPPSPEIDGRVVSSMVRALIFRQPHHPDISSWISRAATVASEAADPNLRMQAGWSVAQYCLWMGDVNRATEMIGRLQEQVKLQTASPVALLLCKSMHATLLWINGDHDGCRKAIDEGLEIAKSTGVHLVDSRLAAQGAYSALSQGAPAAAGPYLSRMTAGLDRPLNRAHHQYLLAWQAILSEDPPRALQYLESAARLTQEVGSPFNHALGEIALAHVLHELGRGREADAYLGRAQKTGRRMHSAVILHGCALAEAWFALRRNRGTGDDLSALRRAMAIGKRHGLMSGPWWRPTMVADLCVKALENGIEVDYVRELVRQKGLLPCTPPVDLEAWPWPVKIYTLGRFEVLRDGKPVQFSRKLQKKTFDLLRAVVALGGRGVCVDRLEEVLWPESEGDKAHHALESALSRVRKLLGNDEAIILQDRAVALDPCAVWVDAWALEQLLEKLDAALSKGQQRSLDAVSRLADKMVTLYRGPFLGEAYPEWAAPARERLRSKVVRRISAVGRAWEGAGRWSEAAEIHLKGLEVDDLNEEFSQRLMTCYGHMGRKAEALAVYDRCRTTLRVKRGVAPSPGTEAVYKSISKG